MPCYKVLSIQEQSRINTHILVSKHTYKIGTQQRPIVQHRELYTQHLIMEKNLFSFFFSVLQSFFLIFLITQMNLSHLYLYNDHDNLISQDFHPIAQAHPPTPQTVSSGDHKFFNVCESASVLQRSCLSFFQIPHVSESIGCWCLIVWLTSLSMIISRSIHVAKNAGISFLLMAE